MPSTSGVNHSPRIISSSTPSPARTASVKQGPVPAAIGKTEVARGPSVASSPTQVKNQYDTTQPQRGVPLTSNKQVSPEQQAAYNSRTHTLGYGRKQSFSAPDSAPPAAGSSSAHSSASGSAQPLEPGWTVSAGEKQRIHSILFDGQNRPIPGASISQYIAHQDNPAFSALPGNGICSAVVTSSLAAKKKYPRDPQKAATALSLTLGNPERLMTRQSEYLEKYGKVSPLIQYRDAAVQNKQDATTELYESKSNVEALQQLAAQQRLTPEQTAQAYAEHARFTTAKANVLQSHQQAEQLTEAVDTAIADVRNHENAGMSSAWTTATYPMRSAEDFGAQVGHATRNEGSYRVSLKDTNNNQGHAMYVENLGRGGYKFVDANSAVFNLSDAHALQQVMTKNAQVLGYDQQSTGFQVQCLV